MSYPVAQLDEAFILEREPMYTTRRAYRATLTRRQYHEALMAPLPDALAIRRLRRLLTSGQVNVRGSRAAHRAEVDAADGTASDADRAQCAEPEGRES
ncbi:hypothetical protein [Microbacterium sp.]|uniref:hypothetical protein n=1 Tax=Microbacterium sp. TaxID=51671 RepID=UPI003242253C